VFDSSLVGLFESVIVLMGFGARDVIKSLELTLLMVSFPQFDLVRSQSFFGCFGRSKSCSKAL
jgi:hypothetical protein